MLPVLVIFTAKNVDNTGVMELVGIAQRDRKVSRIINSGLGATDLGKSSQVHTHSAKTPEWH